MSEVKVGDRVRVVIEADVLEASNFDGDGIMLEGWSFVPPVGELGVVSIEVIPAPFVLPTKRWAQVVDGFDDLWTRDALKPHDWYSLLGDSLGSGKLIERGGLRVISEGVDDE
jgi:hypothetical protein